METILIIVFLIVNLIVSLIVGSFGNERKIGFAGAFFASFLLTPILAMLFVLASDKTGVSEKYYGIGGTLFEKTLGWIIFLTMFIVTIYLWFFRSTL